MLLIFYDWDHSFVTIPYLLIRWKSFVRRQIYHNYHDISSWSYRWFNYSFSMWCLMIFFLNIWVECQRILVYCLMFFKHVPDFHILYLRNINFSALLSYYFRKQTFCVYGKREVQLWSWWIAFNVRSVKQKMRHLSY